MEGLLSTGPIPSSFYTSSHCMDCLHPNLLPGYGFNRYVLVLYWRMVKAKLSYSQQIHNTRFLFL